MPRAYSLQLSRFPLFPPVTTCLRTGLLEIAGRDLRGLSKRNGNLFLYKSISPNRPACTGVAATIFRASGYSD